MRTRRATIGVIAALAFLAAAGSSSMAQPMGAMSNRCFTPQFWCLLPVYGPIGTQCYCGTPYGPVGGFVR